MARREVQPISGISASRATLPGARKAPSLGVCAKRGAGGVGLLGIVVQATTFVARQLYRAMGWLGEPLAPVDSGRMPSRTRKDLIEERLFERRRDLFSALDIVFYKTATFCPSARCPAKASSRPESSYRHRFLSVSPASW